ncbi:MAG TPA: RDD family protein [Terriglobales bacterium]|nr:RDD family protein [Terriglobales bacterium]
MNPTLYCNKCGAANSAEAQFCSRCGSALNPVSAGLSPAAAAAAAPTPVVAGSYNPVVATVGYGGFWIRVVAFIIDGIIVRAAAWPVSIIFGLGGLAGTLGGFPHGAPGLHLFGSGVVLIVVVFGSWLYEAFMLSSPYQATLGKMIFGMKVTDLYGNRVSFARATGRHFAKWLSGMILCIGYIMVAFTERNRGLHDILAGTLVRR